MKRIFTVILAALMFTLATVPAIQAEETTGSAGLYETGSTVEYFEDGSYTVTSDSKIQKLCKSGRENH